MYRMALYTRNFLPYSATFIYRQLQAAAENFDVIVLTQNRMNQDKFPFEPVKTCRPMLIDKLLNKLNGKGERFTHTFPLQHKCHVRYLRRHRTQLIHAHFGPYGLRMLPVAKQLGIPLIVTFHGFDASRLLSNHNYLRELSELFKYATIIAVSDTMCDRLEKLFEYESRVFRHYIGVPVKDFPLYERESPAQKIEKNIPLFFLQVTRFSAKKGHEYTVRAFAEFLKVSPNCRLVFAGDGEELSRVKALCTEVGIDDKVQFLGTVSSIEVNRLMSQADIFLHHSVTTEDGEQEGIPISVLEAMSTGLIVISTKHAGIPEVIEHGVNGFLVPERDVSRYVEVMKTATRSSGLIGRNAAKTIRDNFNLELQNQKLMAIYHEAIHE